ncbi:hypothetical protein yberc0001_24880 [Yersinia bercovieri ATCC 43970]|uniref:Uncharacterized protein n=1 Tax=Yersinia bercovieri ATCC 43970 TaxID=349968 RepID=A0ABM9Y0X7_YERBE|nr:hypothetical protein yberc0001_24880 [Yersinia bercovieri ATCC 43970]
MFFITSFINKISQLALKSDKNTFTTVYNHINYHQIIGKQAN